MMFKNCEFVAIVNNNRTWEEIIFLLKVECNKITEKKVKSYLDKKCNIFKCNSVSWEGWSRNIVGRGISEYNITSFSLEDKQ